MISNFPIQTSYKAEHTRRKAFAYPRLNTAKCKLCTKFRELKRRIETASILF